LASSMVNRTGYPDLLIDIDRFCVADTQSGPSLVHLGVSKNPAF
jgi:hypothetical protein